jgi:hypothetical protein
MAKKSSGKKTKAAKTGTGKKKETGGGKGGAGGKKPGPKPDLGDDVNM